MSSNPSHSNSLRVLLTSSVKMGLLGGIIAVFMGLQGMVVAFNARFIIGNVIAMGQMLIVIALFTTTYLTVVRSDVSRPSHLIVASAVTGAVTSAMLVILVVLGSVIDLGEVFVNAVPQLYALLTLGQGLVTGSVILLILGAVVGVLAALVHLASPQVRRMILFPLSWVIVIGLFQDLIVTTLSNFNALVPLLKFLYTSNGLSIPGTIALLVLFVVLYYTLPIVRTRYQGKVEKMSPQRRRVARQMPIFLLVVVLLVLPSFIGIYLSQVLDDVGLYILLGLGLNIVVGLAGLLDLGYVAFFAIGAYTVGVLTTGDFGHPAILANWWEAVPFAVLAALLAGVLLGIPVLKVRGDYLAIVTLGFGEIIRLMAQSDFLKPFIGGAQGILGIAKPVFIWFTSLNPIQIGIVPAIHPEQFYYIILAGCLLVAFISTRLKDSRMGRAWMALREDEDVAEGMGIDLVSTKLLAFGMGATFGGLSGAIFASQLGSIFPSSFNFLISVNILALIIIGGMGNIPGVIVGALALVGLPELLREFSDYRFLFYGATLVLMMLLRPEGLLPESRRRLELEEGLRDTESKSAVAASSE